MSYPIDFTIPNENNDPIDDVPLMRGNYNNINSYLKVDHIEAGAEGNGFHAKVTYFDVAAPGVPVGNTSVEYTEMGVAAPAVPDLRFKNANGTFPISYTRAVVNFTTIATGNPLNTPVVPNAQFNIFQILYKQSDNYDITLVANSVQDMTTNPPIIQITGGTNASFVNYSIVGASTIRIQAQAANRIINLQVIQI